MLRDRPGAASFAMALAIDPLSDPPLCIHGPDLDTIDHTKCTTVRCASSCSPKYRNILSRFHVVDDKEIDCGLVAQHVGADESRVDGVGA